MVSVCQHDAAVPFLRNPCGVLSRTWISTGNFWNWCCRSISCWALSRYAQWIVERCSDPQQDINAAQLQLDEVLQVLHPALASVPLSAPSLPSAPSLLPASALSLPSAFTPAPFGLALCSLPLPCLSAFSHCPFPLPLALCPSSLPFPLPFPSALSLCLSPLPFLSSLAAGLHFTDADMALEHPTSTLSSSMTYLLTHSTNHTRS